MTAAAVRILVVDDEPPIRRLLRTGLGSQGYEVIEAGDRPPRPSAHRSAPPTSSSSTSACPTCPATSSCAAGAPQARDVPVVILSSRTDEAGIVEALELGADDYVTKPFGMKELVARIRTALRHRLQAQGERALFKSGDLSVDLVRRIVRVGGARSTSRRASTTSCGCWSSTPARS